MLLWLMTCASAVFVPKSLTQLSEKAKSKTLTKKNTLGLKEKKIGSRHLRIQLAGGQEMYSKTLFQTNPIYLTNLANL